MYSQTTPQKQEARIKYIETRWEGLHGLEQKRIDSLLNFLLLASSGLTAAAMAYLGAIVQGGKEIPSCGQWMMAFFFGALLLLGVLKFMLFFNVRKVFALWRSGYDKYISDDKSWDMLIDDDAKAAKDDWYSIGVAITSFAALIVGVYFGYQSLQEVNHGNKATVATIETITTQAATEPASAAANTRSTESNNGYRVEDRNIAKSSATTEEISKGRGE